MVTKPTPIKRKSFVQGASPNRAIRADLDRNPDLPAQLMLLANNEPRHTRGLGLWDAIPWAQKDHSEDSQNADGPREKTFEFRGQTYHLTETPAQIKENGAIRHVFPGDREQKIELLIRKLAADNATYELQSNQFVAVTVKASDIFHELNTLKCGMPYDEIMRSIEILSRTRLALSRVVTDRDGDPVDLVMEANIFPTIAMKKNRRREKAAETVIHLQFNPLISEAIKDLDIFRVAYETQIKLKFRARFVFRCLHHALMEGSIGPERRFVITANQIHSACGGGVGKRSSRTTKIFLAELDQLVSEDVIETYEMEEILERTKGRPRIVDISFTLVVSNEFWRQSIQARGGLREIHERFEQMTGVKAPPKEWTKVTDSERKRMKAAQTTLDLLPPSA